MRFLVLFGALLSGCTTTATFLTRNQRSIEGRIIGGDRERLLVQTEAGAELLLDRVDVTDIDHPGNVVAVIGGILAASGVSTLFTSTSFCSTTTGSDCALQYGLAGGTLALGTGMLTWGLWTWLTSRSLVVETLETRLIDVDAGGGVTKPVP